LATADGGGWLKGLRMPPGGLHMKHVIEQELISPVPTKMDRRAKLLHWAEILRQSRGPLALYHNLEHYPAEFRQTMVVDSTQPTAFGLACADPAFRAQGLAESTTLAGIEQFFDLTVAELHEFSCDCGGPIGTREMADRITALAARR
jgi:hypothetical protein